MSDTNDIKIDNGYSITADTLFANKVVIEAWLAETLKVLQADPKTKKYFDKQSTTDFEVNPTPVPLIDTMSLSTDILTDKRNFASDRAVYEARTYAAMFYEDNHENADFYRNHMPRFIADTKLAFNSSDEKNGRVRILSQTSYLKLTPELVNVFLKLNPNGTDNILRRRKAKPDTFITNDDGTKSRVYYTDEEIAEAEARMYTDNEAHNYIELNVSHVPFSIEYSFLTAASSMVVNRTPRSDGVEEVPIDEIFVYDANESETVNQQMSELNVIAKRDIGLIDLVSARESGGDILSVVHSDCLGVPVPASSEDFLSMHERYMSLMFFVDVMVTMAAPFIDIVRANAGNSKLTSGDIKRIIGIDSVDPDNYIIQLESMLTDEGFMEHVGSLPIKYRIDAHTFIVLFVSIIRRATVGAGVNSRKIVDTFAAHIGYQTPNAYHGVFDKFLMSMQSNVPEVAITNINGMIGTYEGRREPMASYAYRNVLRYMSPEGRFGIELAIIDSCVNITDYRNNGSRKAAPTRYNMLENSFSFPIDALVKTVSVIMSDPKLNDSMNPFTSYKNEILIKESLLNARRKDVAKEIEQVYGSSFPAYCIKLPSIPFSNNDRIWARNKCVKLEEEIKIITELNASYDWVSFRAVYRELDTLTREFAVAEIEDPDVVELIRVKQETYEQMCVDCGLTSDLLVKLKKHEEDLKIYSNIDKMEPTFEPFKFKFKKNLGNEMNFHLGKTSIMYNGSIRTVQSLLTNPDVHVILGNYFRPFFDLFSTINTNDFDITFTNTSRVDTKAKNIDVNNLIHDIIMTVKFGSSDDIHVCSKFRTRFNCILDTDTMIRVAREDAGKSEFENFDITDIDQKFIIKWARNKDQHIALAGAKGESALEAVAKTRGCYEQYPAYDSLMSTIVVKNFNNANNNYKRAKELKFARENERNRPKYVPGPVDELGFGQMSEAVKEQNAHTANKWNIFAKTLKNQNEEMIAILNKPTDDDQPKRVFGTSNTQARQPFGQKKKFGSNLGPSSYTERRNARTVEDTHGGNTEASENAIRTLTREKSVKKWVADPLTGFIKIEYEKKTIISYVRDNGSTTPQDVRERREKSGKTPIRHLRGVIPNNNRSRHSQGYDGRRSTPNSNKASPYRQGMSSPLRGSNTASPAPTKHGYAPGAASPSGFVYYQPDHDDTAVIPTNIYSGGAASPVQGQRQIFEDVEVPTGIFHADNGTPRDNGSQSSRGTGFSNSNVSSSTPIQDFEVNEDEDFEI